MVGLVNGWQARWVDKRGLGAGISSIMMVLCYLANLSRRSGEQLSPRRGNDVHPRSMGTFGILRGNDLHVILGSVWRGRRIHPATGQLAKEPTSFWGKVE